MFDKSQLPNLPQERDAGCREFYLDADIKQARLALLLFIIPLAGFVFNDYLFFNLSVEFFALAIVRIILLSVVTAELVFLGRVKVSASYDKLLLSASFVILIGGGIINFSRPQNFAVQAFITIISIFVLYLAVPLRLLYQSVLSFTATIGEALLVVLLVKPSQSTVMFTLLFSLFLANLIGLMISRQIHSYRERTYGEFLRRKEMQEKLEQTNKNLENMVIERTEKLKKTERFAAIGETAGMVGHDLRNPLTGIMNATYYLKKRYASQIDEKGVEMLKVIEKNAEYSNLIIGDLLDYSRNINLTLVRANLKQVIGDALTIAAVPPSITVVDLMVGSPEVTVDVTMIKRVFVNLIKNAIDAMPQGGKLTIKHETTSDYARIRLSDTGPGISEENLTKIFQPLFTTKKGGIGFGLAFCKRIVEAHNGVISVGSIVGQGTQFTVDLPVKLNN